MLTAYQNLNRDQQRRVIFALTNRGFASELNNLLSAILYCLDEGIEFRMQSRWWTGKHDRGWEDYFLPFCQENNHWFDRRPSVWSTNLPRRAVDWAHRAVMPNRLLAHDIFELLRGEEFAARRFAIPELGIDGDVFEAKQKILGMVYRHNDEVERSLQAHSEMLKRIKPFVSVHVRRGDKVAPKTWEADAIPVEDYIAEIRRVAPETRRVFVATDDYSGLKAFQARCPSAWEVFSLCPKENRGYVHLDFGAERSDLKKQQMLLLFSDLHFLRNSERFIGTYSSNISRLMALFLGRERCHSLDKKEWFAR